MADPIETLYAEIRPNTENFEGEAKGQLLGSVRGIAAALGAAFAAKKIFDFGKQAVDEAALTQKATESIRASFGGASADVLRFSEDAASSFGISTSAGEAFAAQIGLVTQNMGLGNRVQADMAVGLEKLAGSIGLIKGQDPATIFQTLATSLQGSTRGLKSLGITIDTTQIKNEALRLGLIKTTSDAITPGIKAQAIYALATRHLGQQMDEARKHSNDWADVSIRLHAALDNVKETVGRALLPAVSAVGSVIANDVVPRVQEWADELRARLGPIVTRIGGFLEAHKQVLIDFAKSFTIATAATAGLGAALSTVATIFPLLVSPIGIVLALGTAAVYAYEKFKFVRTVVHDVGNAVGSAIAPLRPIFHAFMTDVRNLATEWEFFSSRGYSLSTILQAVVRSALVDLGVSFEQAAQIWRTGVGVFDTVRSAATRAITAIRTAAAGLVSAVQPLAAALLGSRDAVTGIAIAVAGGLAVWAAYAAAQKIVAIQTAITKAVQVEGAVAQRLYNAAMAEGAIQARIMAVAQEALNIVMDTNPIILVAIAIAALVAALVVLYERNATVRRIMQETWSVIQNAVGAAIAFIVPQLQQLWTQLGPEVVAILQGLGALFVSVFGLIREIVAAVMPLVAWYVTHYLRVVEAIWNAIGPTVIAIARNAFNGVVAVVRAAMEIIRGVIEIVTGIIRGDWGMVWHGILTVLRGVWDVIVAVLRTALSNALIIAKAIGLAIWHGIVDLVQRLPGWAAQLFSFLVRTIISFAGGALGAAQRVGSNILNGIISYVKTIPGKVGTWLSQLPGKIRSFAGQLFYAAVSLGHQLFNGIVAGLGDLAGKIWDWVQQALASINPFGGGQPGGKAYGGRYGVPGKTPPKSSTSALGAPLQPGVPTLINEVGPEVITTGSPGNVQPFYRLLAALRESLRPQPAEPSEPAIAFYGPVTIQPKTFDGPDLQDAVRRGKR